jgi:mannitol 2-dehydrogenase
MLEIRKLNAENLPFLPKEVEIPGYDRSPVKTGIVHIGVGAFHRAHQALYTDEVLRQGATRWGICGIGLLESDRRIMDILQEQDGLYTLLVGQPDGTFTARVIGSVKEFLFAPENQDVVLEKMAHPDIAIITMTITEGGYNFNAATGEFLLTEPSIQHDMVHPGNPRTIFGYLAGALKRRRDRGISGLTLQSCDNIQKNGDVLKKMLLSYVQATEPELADWIDKEVTFPNCMVDRITPVTTPADVERLRSVFGVEDAWPVVCEPFIQWVVEDRYVQGRPAWENAGVQFVRDVEPYEKMKIRLLNAGHSLLGFLGTLLGCSTVEEAVRNPLLGIFLRTFMDREVTPLLGRVEGIGLEDYKDSLIRRFGNPNLKDRLSRICLESSAKIPKYLLPTITEQLEKGGPFQRGALVVAAWCRYLELAGTPGHGYEVQDQLADLLQEAALASRDRDPLAFLKVEPVFHKLAQSGRFVSAYLPMVDSLRKHGAARTIREFDHLAVEDIM